MALAAHSLEIPTPRVFAPLLGPARYKGARGGRGSGKSHHFAEAGVEWCVRKTGTRGVCIREVQKTLRESAKRLIEDKINSMGVGHMFRILDDQIRTPGGGVILFQGMQDHTAESIKSLEGFDWAWVEEAQTLSARSLEMLRPTIRKPGSELWFSWNPRRRTDPIDAFFRGHAPPPDSVCVEANCYDNPFLPYELEIERRWDEQNNPERYSHIWDGDYEPQATGAIFTMAAINKHRRRSLAEVEAETEIERIVVAIDHAVSSTEGSNEHGIVVAARGADNRGYLLEDGSRKGTPRQWATRVVELLDKWRADVIVIERNQGGDLVRQNLETERSALPIVEVVATRGKHVRAEPLSSRYALGQISHVGDYPEVEEQLCQITAAGYEGDGSPDRADSVVWAFAELFPTMGKGAVYPIPEADITVDAFQLPAYWPRAYALDGDWRRTAIIWGAVDPHTDTMYLYAEHYHGDADIAVHARAIATRGAWIRGMTLPTAHGRTKADGELMLSQYATNGVHLTAIEDQVESGTAAVFERLRTGRLKVFRNTCPNWLREYRVYHRDDDGEIVHDDCRLMNSTRYFGVSGNMLAKIQPPAAGALTRPRAGRRRAGY